MRLAYPLLLATLAACGGGAKRDPEAPKPLKKTATRTEVLVSVHPMLDPAPKLQGDTLLDEYLATTGKATHDVTALPGEVTCYGGPALDGDLPLELYVRRAIDEEHGVIVEDTVSLSPEDLVPRREIVTFEVAPGVHNVRDGGGYVIGRALVDDADRHVLVTRNWSLGVEVTAREATDGALHHMTYLIAPDLAESSGLVIHDLNRPEDFAAAQPVVLQVARDNTTVSVKGELQAMSPKKCQAIFAHFPPAK